MEKFLKEVQVRWSDLDPNFHLRHSVYYDWGAFCRVEFLNEHYLTANVMTELQFGPILFREECTFRKEIRSGDRVTINLELIKARSDYSRWSVRHEIIKNENTLAAVLSVDGAWISIQHRKLATPPAKVFEVFEKMPRSSNFELLSV
jgi:acyl-CoA thioester hydrolase